MSSCALASQLRPESLFFCPRWLSKSWSCLLSARTTETRAYSASDQSVFHQAWCDVFCQSWWWHQRALFGLLLASGAFQSGPNAAVTLVAAFVCSTRLSESCVDLMMAKVTGLYHLHLCPRHFEHRRLIAIGQLQDAPLLWVVARVVMVEL